MNTGTADAVETTPAPTGQPSTLGRVRLVFPMDYTMDLRGKHVWYMALLKQHRDSEPLFKEGRNAPYITIKYGSTCDMLTTKGFNGTVLVSTSDLQRRTVIICNVPPYVDVDTLECPGGFLWLRRHMV